MITYLIIVFYLKKRERRQIKTILLIVNLNRLRSHLSYQQAPVRQLRIFNTTAVSSARCDLQDFPLCNISHQCDCFSFFFCGSTPAEMKKEQVFLSCKRQGRGVFIFIFYFFSSHFLLYFTWI